MMPIFESKARMPAETEQPFYGAPLSVPGETVRRPPSSLVVRTALTEADQRAVRASNYPRYDKMDIQHAPRRGSDY